MNNETSVVRMISDMHEKINPIAADVAATKALLDTTLPNLATKDHVARRIAEHKNSSHIINRPGVKPSSIIDNGIVKALVTVIIALAAVLAAVMQFTK